MLSSGRLAVRRTEFARTAADHHFGIITSMSRRQEGLSERLRVAHFDVCWMREIATATSTPRKNVSNVPLPIWDGEKRHEPGAWKEWKREIKAIQIAYDIPDAKYAPPVSCDVEERPISVLRFSISGEGDSSRIRNLRGGSLMSTWIFSEIPSQGLSAGIVPAGRPRTPA